MANKRENFDSIVDIVWEQLPHRDPWRNANLTKPELADIVTSVFDTMTDMLADGNDVYIKRFGRFKVVKHRGKMVHIPSGEMKKSGARKYAKFKQFKKLRDAL